MALDLPRIGKLHVGLVGASGGLSYATHLGQMSSVLLGGALMGANFWLMQLLANFMRTAVVDPPSRSSGILAVAAFSLKFGLFVGLIAALFWRLPIEGLSFAFGATLLLVACVVEAIRAGQALPEGVE